MRQINVYSEFSLFDVYLVTFINYNTDNSTENYSRNTAVYYIQKMFSVS